MDQHASARMQRHLSDSLLSAAESCLHNKSHLDVTSREIAAGAGTYAGMVNYYFNNKEGLFSTLVEAVVADADRGLCRIEAAIDAGSDDPTGVIVRGLVEAYRPHSAAISIMFIEVFRQRSSIRQDYTRRGGTHAFDRVERLVRKLVASGIYRHDLDPVAATWMILSLIISPHMLAPVARAMGAKSGAPDMECWIAEVTETLRKHLLAPS